MAYQLIYERMMIGLEFKKVPYLIRSAAFFSIFVLLSSLQYEVKENYHSSLPPDSLTLSLKQGDIVEVLDNSIDGKWFVRAQSGKEGVTHGWFPSSLLERVNRGEEDVDGKKGWVQITAGTRVECVQY